MIGSTPFTIPELKTTKINSTKKFGHFNHITIVILMLFSVTSILLTLVTFRDIDLFVMVNCNISGIRYYRCEIHSQYLYKTCFFGADAQLPKLCPNPVKLYFALRIDDPHVNEMSIADLKDVYCTYPKKTPCDLQVLYDHDKNLRNNTAISAYVCTMTSMFVMIYAILECFPCWNKFLKKNVCRCKKKKHSTSQSSQSSSAEQNGPHSL